MTNYSATPAELCDTGREVIDMEAQALEAIKSLIDEDFAKACHLILSCQQRVIVTGMGKSNHIANKIAATLASTGTPAFALHPGEATHGDMGMVTCGDVILAVSHSGETQELLTLLPLFKRLNCPIIAICGRKDSTLVNQSEHHLNTAIEREACPLNAAPTTSTTAALVIGDALAIALLKARGFSREDFAFSHPGGSLGKRLFLRVRDIMNTGEEIPLVYGTDKIKSVLVEISAKRMGMAGIIDDNGQLLGVFTDGDIRRTLEKSVDPYKVPIQDVMTRNCITVHPDQLASEALYIMQSKAINGLFVLNDHQQIVGAFNMHNLLRQGVY